MIFIPPNNDALRLRQAEQQTQVYDIIRKRWLVLTPEEHVRQILMHHLINAAGYPIGMMAVEKKVQVGTMAKRYDLIVYDRNHHPWLLAECKEPGVEINKETLYQLLNYHRSLQCQYWLLTNGHQTFCADAQNSQQIQWLDALPAYNG